MSISLKNHDDRITALENKISSGVGAKVVDIYKGSTSSYTVPNFSSYNFLLVQHHSGLAGNGGVSLVHIPYMCDYWLYGGHVRDHSNSQCYVGTDGVVKTTGGGNIKFIVGLKIYYIFRYNICEILKLISPILKF